MRGMEGLKMKLNELAQVPHYRPSVIDQDKKYKVDKQLEAILESIRQEMDVQRLNDMLKTSIEGWKKET